MITKLEAQKIVMALMDEGTKILEFPPTESRNTIAGVLLALGSVINRLDNEGFFDE